MGDDKLAVVGFLSLIPANVAIFLALRLRFPKEGMNWRAIWLSTLAADALFHVLGLAVDKADLLRWIAVTIPAGAGYAFLVAAGVNGLLLFARPRSQDFFDQRRTPRLTPVEPLYVKCPEQKRVRDISLAGAFIEEARPLAVGRGLQLAFRLSSGEPVVISGMVQRVEKGRGVGVKFLTMTETHQVRLREFLELEGLHSCSSAAPPL